jgi:DNA-binding CsgD family transcriptional regulator
MAAFESYEAQRRQCTAWYLEDRCFANLVDFCVAQRVSDPLNRSRLEVRLIEHEKVCQGDCWKNVRITWMTTKDPLKKWVYAKTFGDFTMRWLEAKHCTHHVEHRPDGVLARTVFSDDIELPYVLPFTAIECFKPFDRSDSGYVIFDVRSQELFADPRPLIQHLDETATRGVKAYPPATGVLHWQEIVSEGEGKFQIRWNGQVKDVAPDWTLHGRYGRLLKRDALRDESLLDVDRQRHLGEEERADEVLRLREAALKYDGRSWFAGFLKARLEQRRIDSYRHLRADALSHAEPESATCPPEGDVTTESTPRPLEEIRDERSETVRHGHDQSESLVWRRDLLERRLTKRQRRILSLKVDRRLSDEEIGKIVGHRRETVNREMSEIRRKARAVKV